MSLSLSTGLVVIGIFGIANWVRQCSSFRLDLRTRSLKQNQTVKIASAHKEKEKSNKKYPTRADDWVCIGTLEKIIIYPMDDGYGHMTESAHCRKHGLTTNSRLGLILNPNIGIVEMRGYHDRVCLAFHRNSRRVEVRNPDVRLLQDKDFENTIRDQLASYKSLSTRRIVYENEAKSLLVYDLGKQIAKRAGELMLRNTRLNIGYRKRKSKTTYNTAMRRFFRNTPRRPEWILDEFSANFSSYSLVNNDHINELKEKCGRREISYWNFRPNLVIQSNGTTYLEENITAVKIGNVEFCNIIPCSHTCSINYDITRERGDDQEEPFNYLSSHRRLCDLRPDLSSTLSSPIFGINMDLKQRYYVEGPMRRRTPGEIKLGDEVLIKIR